MDFATENRSVLAQCPRTHVKFSSAACLFKWVDQARRSIFGYFCRRCFVSFIKLSFYGVLQLQKDYQAWCSGDDQAGYSPVEKDPLTGDIWIFKTNADLKSSARPEPWEL